MIPEYYSDQNICLKESKGSKREASVGEKDFHLSKRFCVIASWGDWVVASPSDKLIYLIQTSKQIDDFNSSEMKQKKIAFPIIPIHDFKILDLAIHVSHQELVIYLCISKDEEDKKDQERKYITRKEFHEIKYTNITRIEDIESQTPRHTTLLEDKNLEGAAKTGLSRNISLGFDQNPFDEDAKPVKIYYVPNSNLSNSKLAMFDIQPVAEGGKKRKQAEPTGIKTEPVAFVISPHDKNQLAIADKDGKVEIFRLDETLPKKHTKETEIKAGIWKNELLSWHPTKKNWLLATQRNDAGSSGKYSVSCYDVQKTTGQTEKRERAQKAKELHKVSLQSQCTNPIWRPGEGPNVYQILLLQKGKSIYLIDIRRPYVPIGVFKISKDLPDKDISCFTVANDGQSMYAGTSDGYVHQFNFPNSAELYKAVDLPKRAIAVSPWGDLIISTSNKKGVSNDYEFNHREPMEPTHARNAPEDFVAPRLFRWEHHKKSSKSEWWRQTTNDEIKFAAQLFFTRPSPILEAKNVREVAKKMKMVNYEFFDMIVDFLEREESYGAKSYLYKPDKNNEIEYDRNDDLSYDMSDARISANPDDHDDSSDHDSYHEYKPYDPVYFDAETRRSYISDSSITRREIPSDGSIKTDSDPDDPDNSKQDRQRNVPNVNKRVSRDDNMIQINRSFMNKLDTKTLLDAKLNRLADKIVLLGETVRNSDNTRVPLPVFAEDLQAAIFGMCLLGRRDPEIERANIIDTIIGRHEHVTKVTLRNWFHDYLEHITRNALYEHKAAVSRIAQMIQIFQGDQYLSKYKYKFKIGCGRCRKELFPGDTPFCKACRKPIECNICRLPVTNRIRLCRVCGHGGHVDHYSEWFKTRDKCMVAQCDCQCVTR